MKRLPDHFRPALDEIKKFFTYTENMTYNEINKNYKKINSVFSSYNIENYDINNVLQNYDIDNTYAPLIGDMRKLADVRNKEIIRKLYQNDEWFNLIKNTKKDMNCIYSDYIDTKCVEGGLLDVMKKYTGDWLGFWSIVNIYENGEVKSVNLIDTEDINNLKKFLNKKKKLKTKNIQ